MASKPKTITSAVVKLTNWRASFLQIDAPKSFKPGQAPRYEGTFLGDPTNETHKSQIKELMAAAMDVLTRAFPDEKSATLQERLEALDSMICFGKADKHPKKKKYDGYAGMFYIVTANKDAPKVYDRAVDLIVPGHKQWPYSGSTVNTNVTLWVQDNEFGRGVRANLRTIQFAAATPPFGKGNINPADEFVPLAGDNATAASEPEAFDDDIPF